MRSLPTIEINDPDSDGKLIINEADFDPEIHSKFGEKKAPAKKAVAKKAAAKADE